MGLHLTGWTVAHEGRVGMPGESVRWSQRGVASARSPCHRLSSSVYTEKFISKRITKMSEACLALA